MSDFLQNLVARSQGALNPVQPLAIPRFALLPMPDFGGEVSEAVSTAPAPPTDGVAIAPPSANFPLPAPVPLSDTAQASPPVAPPNTSGRAPQPLTPAQPPSPPVPQPSSPPALPAAERMVNWLHTETVTVIHPPAASPMPGPPGRDGHSTEVEIMRPVERDTAAVPSGNSSPLSPPLSPSSIAPTAITPAAIVPPPLPPLVPQPPPPAPTVKINIGRLEVRAVPPSPPPAVPKSRPQSLRRPAVSLDQYLQQRSRGS